MATLAQACNGSCFPRSADAGRSAPALRWPLVPYASRRHARLADPDNGARQTSKLSSHLFCTCSLTPVSFFPSSSFALCLGRAARSFEGGILRRGAGWDGGGVSPSLRGQKGVEEEAP